MDACITCADLYNFQVRVNTNNKRPQQMDDWVTVKTSEICCSVSGHRAIITDSLVLIPRFTQFWITIMLYVSIKQLILLLLN